MRRSVKNTLRAGALCLILLACALFTTALAAEGDVTYVKYSWEEGIGLSSTTETLHEGEYTLIDSPMSLEKWGEDREETWYVIQGTINNTNSVVIHGNVSIILTEGCDFTAPRVCVDPDNSLTIYGQAEGTGTLTAGGISGQTSAGIGGMTSHSGNITIHGGTINATGCYTSNSGGAGIGGGDSGNCGTVTIYSGVITAKGCNGGTGIGGGANGGKGGNVKIYGGTVIATGSKNNIDVSRVDGDGIGGGSNSDETASTDGTLEIKNGAFVVASSIGDQSGKGNWNGVVFEGTSGWVYGDVTLTDAEVPAGYTLTINEGQTLTVAHGATLAVKGTLINNGTVSGDVTFPEMGTGTGTDADPYKISTADGLRALADIVDNGYNFEDKTVVLGNDIDLNGGGSNRWTPIGRYNDESGSDTTYSFNGTFDGQGHTISGLYIDTEPENPDIHMNISGFQGLFGRVGEQGTIKNLALDGEIIANNNSGSFAAENKGTIENCYSTVKIHVVAQNGGSGGIAGENSGTIRNCYFAGEAVIQAYGYFAGICYDNNRGTLENCYSAGTTNAMWQVYGCIAINSGTATGCYYLDTTATTDEGNSTTLTAAQFADSGSFPSWNFINTWVMSTELGRPVLRSVPEGSKFLIDYVNEKATGLTVYEISTNQSLWQSGAGELKVTPGGTLYVRNVYDKTNVTTVQLPARPAAPALAINSATQSVTVGDTLEYSFDQTEWTSGTGEAVPVDAGDTIYIRYKASQEDGKFSSQIQALTAHGGAPAPGTPAIDYTGETVGTEAGMQYSLSETGPWTACTADMPAADFGWDGAEPVTVYFRADPGAGYPGEPVELTIPARPAAPVVKGATGRIAGADKSMEYSAGGENWTRFTDETLGRMEPGEYQVRYAATESSFRSEAAAVTVAPGGQGVNVPETYGIELIAGEGGEAMTSLTNASAGTKITVTATPDEGYELAYITVDGERISGASFTMPAHDVTVRVYFTDADAPVFVDVDSGDWFYDYVQYVARNGLMEGAGEGRFEPDGAMTRAMFWAVLARIDGETITGDGWKTLAQDWAVSSGISDGTNADALITREQMVTMLYRYAGSPAAGGMAISEFTDTSSVSDYATDAVTWALSEGVLAGMGDGILAPQGTATRAQAAAMLMRFVER